MPARPMARLLMAPSVSPISSARAVPMAWDDVPIASPPARGFFILSSLKKNGPRTAPVIPVIITEIAVIDGSPPRLSAASTAMGVVTDFGTRDSISSSGSPIAFEIRMTDTIEAAAPAATDVRITAACFFKMLIRRYSGTASETVAGPSKKEMPDAPA